MHASAYRLRSQQVASASFPLGSAPDARAKQRRARDEHFHCRPSGTIRGSRFAKRQALAFLRSRPPTTGIPNFYYLLLDDRGQARGFVEEAQPLRGQIYSVCSEAFPSASVERGTSVDDTKHSVRNKLTVSAVLRPRNLRPSDSRCTDVPWMRSLRLLNANPRGDRTRNARYRNASEAPGEDHFSRA